DRADLFIDKEHNSGYEHTFQDIKWCNRKEYKCGQAIDRRVHCCSHFHKSIDRHSERCSISRQKDKCIHCASDHRHCNRACSHTDKRCCSCTFSPVDQTCRNTERTTDDKVRQLTYSGCICT